MNKIKCLIVDDEPLALNLLEDYIHKTSYLELVGKCNNAIEAISLIDQHEVDLLFLDIQMPEMTGLDLSKTIKYPSRVIFTTAFDQYALDGYKVDALDFLLKPFDYKDFFTAAEKAKSWFDLLENKENETQKQQRNFIFVKSEYKQIQINLDDILLIEGLKDYAKIWLLSQPRPILTLLSLKSLEEELPSEKFMRIHRSFIVSLSKIKTLERSQVIIADKRITIAEQYKEKFQQFVSGKALS
jgi:DNA-binding LytR/AlgR family response regulator